ncbi:MAG: PadR family transcriptional regulator [Actinobacteria bacterium]|nr:PadR family transcriptional regulator [Actinomycetota bacterium]
MAKRSNVLEFAVLGLLHDSPMHGYELRKRINAVLGSFRAISYGSLYPCLKQLLADGLICEAGPADAGAPALSGRRAKIVYQLTADGKERLDEMLADAGPQTWDDERFGVHFAFFSRTDSEVRMRILQGRRSRLEERLTALRSSFAQSAERVDSYTDELARHGLDGVEREVRWLSELIATEQSGAGGATQPDAGARTQSGTSGAENN